ncbi:MAG: terpene cyclase/mutase family protein [Planctomycetes bacterium]|nr:terpene cyclase/mutase family protein [Planctomycetota bacterium]
MRKISIFGLALALAWGSAAAAVQDQPLEKRLKEAYERAADWLVEQQDKDGAWMSGPKDQRAPSLAYTALIVTALGEAPGGVDKKYKSPVEKAVAFLVSKQNTDGSFGEGPSGSFLKVYTTSLGLMAISIAAPDQKDAIGNARGYLKNNQLKEGLAKGGLGYGDQEPGRDEKGRPVARPTIPNLSTTGFAAEGMKRSGLPKDDPFWKLVVEYVERCQNNSETNDDPEFVAKLKEQGLSVGDDGGLFYAADPDRSVHKAGFVKVVDKEVIKSYGSMTYDGIKTYIYAGLSKDDPRVKAAVDWVRKNYSVEGHPGFPFDDKRTHLQGLFYYYLMMARAFDALGEKTFKTFDGKEHEWAAELGEQLLKVQKEQKMWVNENPRWWESDPLLVTSYVLNVLNAVMKYVP